MPIYTPDPTKVSSGFQIFPKGHYEFIIGAPKGFHKNETEEGKNDGNYGVGYLVVCAESDDQPQMKDQKLYNRCFVHTPESESFTKQFQVAALGCKDDAEFNEKYGQEEWWINTDDDSFGKGWNLLEGKRITCDIKVVMGKGDYKDKEQNQFSWKAF